MQYEKSYGDLVKKMGMESIAEELKSKKLRWNGGLTMEIDESVFIADGAKGTHKSSEKVS